MRRLHLASRASLIAVGLALAAAPLAACNRDVSGATAGTGGIPSPVAPESGAPQPLADAGALPPAAPPPPIARVSDPASRYAYLDHAYYMRDALGDAPPDYAFDYGGAEPWVWRSATRDERLAEPVDGGWREYYYRPGEDYPYLIADPGYTYAFDDGALAAIYDAAGVLLPYDQWSSYAPTAGRYLSRGEGLYRASLSARRAPVPADRWSQAAGQFGAERAAWTAAQSRDAGWRDYHQAHAPQAEAYWRPELGRRQAPSVQVAQAAPRPFVSSPPVFAPPRGDLARRVARQDQARFADEAARGQARRAAELAAERGRGAAMQARHQAEAAQRAAAQQARFAEASRQAEQGRRQAEAAQRAQAEQGRRQAEWAQRAQAAQARQHQAQAAQPAHGEQARGPGPGGGGGDHGHGHGHERG